MKIVINDKWVIKKHIESGYLIFDLALPSFQEKIKPDYNDAYNKLGAWENTLALEEIISFNGVYYKVVDKDIMPYFEPL
jgi:hypothetical protein